MSNKLMVRYKGDDYVSWSWVSLDEDNKPFGEVQTGDLTELAEYADGKRIVLVISGRSLIITSVDLPGGNVRTITSAIPYAMEEQLADEVENMHFVSGQRRADGSIPVVAISKQLFTELLQRLADVNLYPAWVVAEPLLLPWREHELSISILRNRAIVRDGELSGYGCAVDQLPALLECSGCIEDDIETIIRVWRDSNQSEIGDLLHLAEDKLIIAETESEFDCLTELGLKQPQLDILQGFDAPKPPKTSSGGWRPAIALSIIAATVYLGTSVYHYFSLQQEIKGITQQTEQLFRNTFPDVKRLVQPLVQAQQKLDQRIESYGQASDALLDMLLALGSAKQSIKSIEFKNLEYRQKSMVVHLQGKSVAQIERFKQQLESRSNTTAKILSTQSKEGRVEARIKIDARST